MTIEYILCTQELIWQGRFCRSFCHVNKRSKYNFHQHRQSRQVRIREMNYYCFRNSRCVVVIEQKPITRETVFKQLRSFCCKYAAWSDGRWVYENVSNTLLQVMVGLRNNHLKRCSLIIELMSSLLWFKIFLRNQTEAGWYQRCSHDASNNNVFAASRVISVPHKVTKI